MKLSSCALLALLPLAACSGGSGGGESSSSLASGLDVLLTDAPADDLLYLRARVESVRLERDDATLTGELLTGPVTVDLRSLDGIFEWLVADELASGGYSGARLAFDPAGFEAAATDGSPVAVVPLASELSVDFPAALQLTGGGYARVEVDFDLLASVDGTVASGTVFLTPAGSVAATSGDDGIAIDEIKGTVVSFSSAAATLVVDAFADGDLAVPLGPVDVTLTPSTLLVDDDGAVFAGQAAFFSALVAGASLVEVHGNLGSGAVTATKVEIEDSFGSGGLVVAEIRGKVVEHAPGASLELLIQEVKKGASVVLPVLADLGNPSSIAVSIEPTTLFFLDDSEPATEAALAVGQTVKVKFLEFASQPFPAFKIEIENGLPEFEGFITDLAGLPESFVMRLKASEPAVLAGLVASSSTDVVVDLASASFLLKVDDKPALSSADLQVGLKVEVYGTLSGPPEAPQLAAGKVQVFPGRLDGALLGATDPLGPGFSTFGGEVEDPFGAGITAGPLDVVIEPGCVFEGDAESAAELFSLGGSVELRIEGLASGQPNEIRAFTVKSDAD